jgi:hypothetical protein
MTHPFTVRYVDETHRERDFCLYAANAYEARITAMEMVEGLSQYPNRIKHVLKEADHFDW